MHQTNLCSVLHTLLLITRALFQRHLRVTRQIRQARTALKLRQLTLCRSQLAIDNANAFLDEFGRLLRYLVFLIIRILIIKRDQTIHEVHPSLFHSVFQTNLSDCRRLRRRSHAQRFSIRISRRRGSLDISNDIHLILFQLRHTIRRHKAENAHGSRKNRGQRVECLLHDLLISLYINLILRLHGQVSRSCVPYTKLNGTNQTIRLFRRNENMYGGIFIQRGIEAKRIRLRLGDIQPHIAHHLLDQRTGFQDLHLVIKVTRHREHSHILHRGETAHSGPSSLALILLD